MTRATATVAPAPPPDTILRAPEVLARVGLSRTSLYKLIRTGRFPPPLRLTDSAVGWRRSDIDAWIASRENPTEAARVPTGGR